MTFPCIRSWWALALGLTLLDPAHADQARQATAALQGGSPSPSVIVDAFPPTQGAIAYPDLPPDPYADDQQPLPPLAEELYRHGGAHLYRAEGDRFYEPRQSTDHAVLRLPESWQAPEPFTWFSQFVGEGPINTLGQWPGGYHWEPRFVAFGRYQVFGFALEENSQRQDVLGHQLLVDLDLQLTGTERFHVQFRPLGERNTGGSYYQLSDPEGYIDNSTGMPDRYWFEAELHSVLGGLVDPFAVRDINFVGGQFPVALHNSLLLNDDLLGVVVSKNTWLLGDLSNLNVQLIYAANELDAFTDANSKLYGTHLTADYRHALYEASYLFLEHDRDDARNSHFAAVSRTKVYGAVSLAGRAMFKWGDAAGRGEGQLYVLEANRERWYPSQPCGIEKGLWYVNAFHAADGWNTIAGGNFNRLRATFEVNPLVQIAAGLPIDDIWGVAAGVQLFRCHEDESWIPEVAVDDRGGELVWGVGLRYLRKLSPRTYVDVLGSFADSDDPRFDREGVFASYVILF